VLQEWKIIKTNRNGKRQERVLGIDGSKIYNSKRLDKQRVLASSQVTHRERDILEVKTIEISGNDNKSFKIKYKEASKGEHEYTCETQQQCQEIVGKVQFIMGLNKQKEEQLRRGTIF